MNKSNIMSKNDWYELIKSYVNNNMNDYDIYNNLRLHIYGNSILSASSSLSISNNDINNDINNDSNRTIHLTNQILECIPSRLRYNGTIKKVLDFGCSEGGITSTLAKQLNLKKDEIYGVDTRTIPHSDHYTFIKIFEEENVLPFANNSIDLIIASMVLHHINNQLQIIQEFKRIISNNGIVIIREHDCNNDRFGVFLDICHGLYSYVDATVKWPGFTQEANMTYRSKNDWTNLIEDQGFTLIANEQEDLPRKQRVEDNNNKRKITNLLRTFCAVFSNNDNNNNNNNDNNNNDRTGDESHQKKIKININ